MYGKGAPHALCPFKNHPMKTEQSLVDRNGKRTLFSDPGPGPDAGLVFVFGSTELLKQQHYIDLIRSHYPVARIVGCSTAGQIRGEIFDSDGIVCTAVGFEHSTFRVVAGRNALPEHSFAIGEEIAAQLAAPDLVHVMVFSEGLNINGSELTKGMNRALRRDIPVTGGLAGDNADFRETVIVDDCAGEKNIVLAIGFYGDRLKTGYGCQGGWDSFGVDRLVTRSEGNILYELDGQPALELYKRYLGEHAAGLPASALLFPLSLRLRDTGTTVVRTVLSVNEHDGSMVFAGDIPQGDFVRLMKANTDRLITGAGGAAEEATASLGAKDPDLAILISCVGRKLVLKQRVEEELEVVRDAVGPSTRMAGFYSYGEICPGQPFDNHCELHNQTMTITLFKEY